MSNLAAKMREWETRFQETVALAPVVDVYGVVDAKGPGGRLIYEYGAHMDFMLEKWRLADDTTLRPKKLNVRMRVEEQEEIMQWATRIKPYDVVHLRGRVAHYTKARGEAMVMTELVSAAYLADAELRAYAEEKTRPVIYEDAVWGKFTLEKYGSTRVYEGHAVWNGLPVSLELEAGDDLSAEAAAQVARELWQDQAGWSRKVADAAVAELLEMQQGEWPLEDEAPLTEAQLRERLKVTSIVTSGRDGGRFAFWHVGDVFHGHDVQVCGTLSEGITDVSVQG